MAWRAAHLKYHDRGDSLTRTHCAFTENYRGIANQTIAAFGSSSGQFEQYTLTGTVPGWQCQNMVATIFQSGNVVIERTDANVGLFPPEDACAKSVPAQPPPTDNQPFANFCGYDSGCPTCPPAPFRCGPGPSSKEVHTTPDGSRILVIKDVGIDRWTILRGLDDETITGTVTPPRGDPTFVHCEMAEKRVEALVLDCVVADACLSSPCRETAWESVGRVELPPSFFEP